jgi:hypothetical protein
MKRRLTSLCAMVVLSLAGCGRSTIVDSDQRLQLHDATGQPGAWFDLAYCSAQGGPGLSRACTIDSDGKVYPEDGTLFVEAAAPPYAAYYKLRPGFEPTAADLAVPGLDAPVTAFAAPYDVARSPCCAENDTANLVPARLELTPGGGLLVTITQAVPAGDQIAFTLSYGALFRSQLDPCTLPDASFCGYARNSGFAMRFYVGKAPAGSMTSPPGQDGGAPAGACLLAYNDALVSGDSCCYRNGGSNACNKAIACNARSGSGCCLIYGTEATAGGERCCLYDGGRFGDAADECRTLLASGK